MAVHVYEDSRPPASRARWSWVGVVLVFLCTTALLTWPQVIHPASVPPHDDAWFSMWRIAWFAHQLPRDPWHLFDGNIYYPHRRTLAYSDATLLQGAIGAPLIWAGVPTPLVYNLLVFGSFVFSGVAAWALTKRLTGSTAAGIVAGLLFAYAPFRFDHYFHLELLWSGWMPLTLLALERTLTRGDLRSGLAVVGLFTLQVLSCIYYGVLFGTVLAVMAVVLAVGRPHHVVRRAVMSLAAGALVAIPVLLLYMQPYRLAKRDVGEREQDVVQLYSGGPKHYFSATPDNILYGWTARLGRNEKRLFPGVCALILAAIGVWPPLDRMRLACLAGLVIAVDLSFGLNGLTYGWLREHVIAYRGLRVPARAGQLVLFLLATLAGYGMARTEAWWRSRSVPHGPAATAVAMCMALELMTTPDTLVPVPTSPAAVYQWLRDQPAGVVAELPMPEQHYAPLHDAEFMYASTFHWKPLVNGYSGYAPDSYVRLVRTQLAFPSPASIRALREAGVTYVILHERLLGSDVYENAVRLLAGRRGVEANGPFAEKGFESIAYRLYD